MERREGRGAPCLPRASESWGSGAALALDKDQARAGVLPRGPAATLPLPQPGPEVMHGSQLPTSLRSQASVHRGRTQDQGNGGRGPSSRGLDTEPRNHLLPLSSPHPLLLPSVPRPEGGSRERQEANGKEAVRMDTDAPLVGSHRTRDMGPRCGWGCPEHCRLLSSPEPAAPTLTATTEAVSRHC